MAQDIVNENQNLSYTNLDFSSIYTEVLDMVKQLTKNWDPSISDESDPGVILVKLSALLADKMNYNIDKSILEAFPLSVTQDSNARQLYDQLGYYMHWYRAATVPVTMSWTTDTVNDNGETISYTIPKFTPITDENETVIYTLVGSGTAQDVVVSDGLLYTTSNRNLNMIAYEGVPVQFTFNEQTTITPNMVDNQNRLYLTTSYVFENGVFINNVDQNNYAEWHRVDNLYEYSYNVHRYKFGYDSASNLCYLEFPDNYAELFGSGIEIIYLTFSNTESFADVPAQYLSKFLTPLYVGDNAIGSDTALTSSVMTISNPEPAQGHLDKEGIDEAYTNYKKVIGTFKTLITLRDYLNYIRSQDVDICSNALVTDRTNDVQSTYKVVNKYKDVESLLTEVERSSDKFTFVKVEEEDVSSNKDYYTFNDETGTFELVSNPVVADISNYYERLGDEVLTPFSLKFYLLQKAVALTTRLSYDTTFDVTTENIDINALLENTSHLVHTFNDIEPIGEGSYRQTTDNHVTFEEGVPTKIYFKYNHILNRYDPVPVTSLVYSNYSPASMNLYVLSTNYVRTSDVTWRENVEYFYRNGAGEFVEFEAKTESPYKYQQPNQVIYIWEDLSTETMYSSYIYINTQEYVLTEDAVIVPDTTYFDYNSETKQYVEVELPEPYNIQYEASEGVSATIDSGVFASVVSEEGTYKFTKESVSDSWVLSGEEVSLDTYGIVVQISSEVTYPINLDVTWYESINPSQLGLFELISESLLPHIVMFKNKYPLSMSIATYNTITSETKQDILSNIYSAFYANLDSSNIEFGDTISLDYLTNIVVNSDARIKSVAFEALSYTTSAVYWDKNQKSFIEVTMPEDLGDMDKNTLYLNPSYDRLTSFMFGKDIICKSILAGVTQLIIPDNVFAYHLNQRYINQIEDIKYITGEAVINMDIQDPYYVINNNSNPQVRRTYTLQENETLTLYKPKISDVENFTSNVHYEYLLFGRIEKNQSYQLKRGEYFIFYIQNLDSDGILESFTVYVYGEGAIIKPTFDIESRAALSVYGDIAINMLGENSQYISTNSKLYTYTESRGNQVSQINNDTTIGNTFIETNQSISAQTLNTFTIDSQEGYRFIWVLNNPTSDGALKQYKLLDGYNPDEDADLTSLNSANSYTLKSGEYLYYTDSSMATLGILGAGTTVYRNCGIESDVVPVTNLSPMVYVNWGALEGSSTYINASGFDKVKTIVEGSVGNILPADNGFYEYDSANQTYRRITDNTREDSENWYVLVMKDVSGWYVQNDDSTDPILVSSNNSSIFSAIDIATKYPKQDVNPSEKGFYEMIEHNGVPLQDDYYRPLKSCTTSGDYLQGMTASQLVTSNRFAKVKDTETSVITSLLVPNVNGTITDTKNPTGNILYDGSSAFSPIANNWMLETEVGGETELQPATISDSLFIKTTDVTYNTTIPTQEQSIYYYKLHSSDNLFRQWIGRNTSEVYYPMINTGYSEDINQSYLYGTSTYSLSRIYDGVKDTITTTSGLISVIDEQWANNNTVSDLVSDWKLNRMVKASGDYSDYIPGTDPQTETIYVRLSADDFSHLSALTAQQRNALKNNIKFAFVKEDGDGALINIGIFLHVTAANYNISFGRFTSSNTFKKHNIQTYVDQETGTNKVAWYSFKFTSVSSDISIWSPEGVERQIAALTDLADGYLDYYFNSNRTILIDTATVSAETTNALSCNFKSNLQGFLNILNTLQSAFSGLEVYELGIYFLPVYYKMRPWVGYKDKIYYEMNKYYTKTYAQVDPLVCPVTDSFLLSASPLSVLRTQFQSVQPNTSLTFTQNELQTLSQGDTISFETLDSTNPTIKFPTFTNKEVVLNLNDYSVSYRRVGNDLVTLSVIDVEGCDWKAYSNLLLNTNSANGQKLATNQHLTLYNSSYEELGEVDNNDNSNVHFQLRYPMSNLSGTFIDVSTSNMVQTNLLNTLYAYNVSQSTENYAFTDDDFKTYVYMKKSNLTGEYTFNSSGIIIENILLSEGDYILPINGLSGIRIEIVYNVPSTIEVVPSYRLSDSSIDTVDCMSQLGENYGQYNINYNTTTSVWDLVYGDETTPGIDLTQYGIELPDGYTAQEGDTFEITYIAQEITPIVNYADLEKSYFLGDKLHFGYLPITREDDRVVPGQLRVKILNPDGTDYVPESDDTITVIINDIFKFVPNPALGEIFDDIKNKVIDLDVNQRYNYTHIPAADDIIADPLLAREYWNTNHIANPFTIAQLDFDDIEYKFIT